MVAVTPWILHTGHKKLACFYYYDEDGWIPLTDNEKMNVVHGDDKDKIHIMMNDHNKMNGTNNELKRETKIQIKSDS